jgi:hypothetical protein
MQRTFTRTWPDWKQVPIEGDIWLLSKFPHPNSLHEQFIDIAPAPVFARFERFNQRMFGLMKVLGGVFVLRRIAAAHMSADQALA